MLTDHYIDQRKRGRLATEAARIARYKAALETALQCIEEGRISKALVTIRGALGR